MNFRCPAIPGESQGDIAIGLSKINRACETSTHPIQNSELLQIREQLRSAKTVDMRGQA